MIDKEENDSLRDQELRDLFVLFGAILMGEIEVVRHILSKGFNINQRLQNLSFEADEENLKNTIITGLDTPLLVALKHNSNIEIVKLLLENGADINLMDQNGKNSLNIASEKNLTDIIELFNAQNNEP